jgi:ubiquinone/menaquinone biosynthesis C-methylase UbiE
MPPEVYKTPSAIPEGQEELYRQRQSREEDTDVMDRDLEAYCNRFGIKKEDLKGKRILDVGSGSRERFSREASEVGAEVFSLNPNLRQQRARRNVKMFFQQYERVSWRGRSIAGRVQELPLKREALFDIIVSFGAPPTYYMKNAAEKFLAIKEMVGVLKPDGFICLSRNDPRQTIELGLGKPALEWLREHNYSIDEGQRDAIIIRKISVDKQQG